MNKYFIHFTQYYNYLILINYKLFFLEIKYIYIIKCIIKKFNSLSNHKIELFVSSGLFIPINSTLDNHIKELK